MMVEGDKSLEQLQKKEHMLCICHVTVCVSTFTINIKLRFPHS